RRVPRADGPNAALVADARERAASHAPRTLVARTTRTVGCPVPGRERTCRRLRRIAALLRHGSNRIFLLQRQARRQQSEPRSCGSESTSSRGHRTRRVDVARELASAPHDAASSALEDRRPILCTLAHEGIGILRRGKPVRIDDVDGRTRSCTRSSFYRVRSRGAAGLVPVEADRDALEAGAREALEGLLANRAPSESDDVRDLPRAELMYVEQSFD